MVEINRPAPPEHPVAGHGLIVPGGDAGDNDNVASELALRESLRELRHREEQLRQSEQQFRDFVENAVVGLHQVGPDGTILWANRAELELLGYARDEYIGRSIVDVHADRSVIEDMLARLGRGEELHNYEARLRAKDGSIKHVLISSNAHSRDGQLVHTRCFTRDITERKRAEEALRIHEAQRQIMIDALPVLVAYLNADCRYELVNAGYEDWFGYAPAAIRGKHISEVIGAAACEVLRPELERTLAGEIVTLEKEVPYRTGTRFVHATYLPQRDSTGQVSGLVTLVADVTKRKSFEIENARLHRDNVAARSHAEQLYRFASSAASADKLEDVCEAGLDAIAGTLGTDRAAVLLFDDEGVMRFRASRNLSADYRRAVEGHSPWPRDAVAPQPVLVEDVEDDGSLRDFLPLFHSEGIGSLAFFPLVTHGRLLGKFMIYHRERHSYSQTEVQLASAIGNHLGSVTSRFTAVAELERSLHYSELFAGVLAHDLRNPLSAIQTAAQLVLMRQEGEGDRDAKPLSRIVASSQRMERMIDQLLDLTRARVGGGIEIQACEASLGDLCRQAISELELVYSDRTFQCSSIGDQHGVWDPDRLLQIISNLVANAIQHGRSGAAVEVRLDGRQTDSVILEVHNHGAIASALLPTIFDPFRGARPRRGHARGLGLGLFIVKELVRAHGGSIDVRSSESDGTTFTIQLPRGAGSLHARTAG